MTIRQITARGIVSGVATGPALISAKAFSFLGDVDIKTGEVVNAESPIRGQSVKGRVLVVPDTVGSAGSWRFLYQLHVHGTSPAAIVSQNLPDSSLVQGAILAGVPMVCSPEVDAVESIKPFDVVTVNGSAGCLTVEPSNGSG
jgi:phosphomecalonate degydratase small subunit